MKYIFPKLPAAKHTNLIRIGGNGLANCLFVYAKAIALASKYKAKLIQPTWLNLSLGTYLRRENDKRHYANLFLGTQEIKGLKRFCILEFSIKTTDVEKWKDKGGVLQVEGIYDFFKPLLPYHSQIKHHLLNNINPSLLVNINRFDFEKCAAVHVRLGDFPKDRRISLDWYVEKIKELDSRYSKFLLFSDGKDDELQELLIMPKVERVFFGGAIQDIIAISRCEYCIGSNSSFSAWGCFIGQIPCIFKKLQFGQVLIDKSSQIIEQ